MVQSRRLRQNAVVLVASLILTAGAVLAAGTANAQSAPEMPAEDWMRTRLGGIGQNQTIDQVRQSLRYQFFNADIDGGGISQSDYELARKITFAQMRANVSTQIMVRDLDGDGKVTRAELETVLMQQATRPLSSGTAQVVPTPEQTKEILARLVSDALKADSNGNGEIEFSEAYRIPEEQTRWMRQSAGQNALPWSFDTDKNGIISLAEYDAVANRVIEEVDADKNGKISQEESIAFAQKAESARRALQEASQKQAREAEVVARAKSCALPAPASGDKVVLLGAYEGKTLSNISIGGDDLEVGSAHVEIEKGDEPLYIVATSFEAMVWHVTGETNRVAKFVAISMQAATNGTNRAAVSGMAKDRVAVAAAANCLRYFNDAKSSEGLRAAGEVKGLLGRAADDVVASYGMGKVSLPSGIQNPDAKFPMTRILPKSGPGAVMWRESLRYAPGGVADLDADKVVSPLAVKAYEVLPQQAGLAQLLDEGALEAVGSQRVRQFGNLTIVGEANVNGMEAKAEYSLPRELRIVKKMRFPAGLNGGHSVKFILGKGVPMPDGSPGHSQVISEETGAPIGGPGTH